MNDPCQVYVAVDGYVLEKTLENVWYDEVHEHILTIQKSNWQNNVSEEKFTHALFEISLQPKQNGRIEGCLLSFSRPVTFISVKQSLDRQFVALQKSDLEIEVIDVKLQRSYHISCKSKAKNRILQGGILWSNHSSQPNRSQDLYLITKCGIEHYKASSKRRSCKFVRQIPHSIHSFWYSARFRVVLLGTGSTEIRPYLLHGIGLCKLQKLVFPIPIAKDELNLVVLYDALYLVYINTPMNQIMLYEIQSQKIHCIKTLALQLPDTGQFDLAVVDNLLVCFSREYNVCQFYDIQLNDQVVLPFVHPLPIGHERQTLMRSNSVPIGVGRRQSIQKAMSMYQIGTEKTTRLKFFPPCYVEERKGSSVGFHSLQLNLPEVKRCASRHPQLLSFLIRRSDTETAKDLIFETLVTAIEDRISIQEFANAISWITAAQSINARLVSEDRGSISLDNDQLDSNPPVEPISSSPTRSMLLVITQTDMLERGWKAVKAMDYGSYLIEYLKSLHYYQIAIEDELAVFVARVYIQMENHFQLLQCLSSGCLGDFVDVALLLISKSHEYPPYNRVALDMLHRLERFDLVVSTLLTQNKVVDAMRIVLAHQEEIEPTLELVSSFFTAGLQKKESLFQLKYSFFLRWGQKRYLEKAGDTGKSLLCRKVGHFPEQLHSAASTDKFKILFGFN